MSGGLYGLPIPRRRAALVLLALFTLPCMISAGTVFPAHAGSVTVPVPRDARGLRLLGASIRIDVSARGARPSQVTCDLEFRAGSGPSRREFDLTLPEPGMPSLAIALDGDSLSMMGPGVPASGEPPAAKQTWSWQPVSSRGSHRLRFVSWAEIAPSACSEYLFRIAVDLHDLQAWNGSPPPVKLAVHFDPIVGREDLDTSADGAIYDHGTLSWELNPRRLADEIVIEWSADESDSAELIERHVMSLSDPQYQHHAFRLGEPCVEDPVRDSLEAVASGPGPDSLSASMRRWVREERARVLDMVSGLTKLRDQAPRRGRDPDAALNPVARRNLVIGRALVRALDDTHAPSRIVRDMEQAFGGRVR